MKIINNHYSLGSVFLIFSFLSVLSHGTEDPNYKENNQLELAACTKKINEICGEKPILRPSETSAHESCVLKSIENIDDECQSLLKREINKNKIDVRTLPNLVQ